MDQRNVNLKSRILLESAEHQVRNARRVWQPTWTKRPRYDGQATFNSKNGMQQVPFAKPHAADQTFWTATPSLREDLGLAQQWDGASSGTDPIMQELTEMQRKSSPDSDAQCKGQGDWSSQDPTQSQHRQGHPSDDPESTRENDRDFKQSDAALHVNDGYLEPPGKMFLQPETRPITQDQLLNEVKGIYAGLVMTEKKCIEIDQQKTNHSNKLSDEQWQTLISLHRTLLYEHHDFFLATQHPSASSALRRLAVKYAMPSRMLRHGIHAFLELLHQRLPDSLEHMLAFVDLAKIMVTSAEDILPEADKQWADCQQCLESYCEMLAKASSTIPDVRDNSPWDHSSGAWAARSSPSSWSTPCDSMPTAAARQEEDFGDWYFRHYPPPGPPSALETEQSYNKLPHLTDTVLCLLSGWLVYGQVITMNFNTYCKVFYVLLLSGMTDIED
jgi:hypothetical protein